VPDQSPAVTGVTPLDDLAASEERFRAVIEASPVAILEVDRDTLVRSWNPAAERTFGWSQEEMIGQSGSRLVPPERWSDYVELVSRVRSGEAYTGFETVRLCKDGTLIEVEISAAPICDAAGAVVRHIVIFGDITERKRQEAEVHHLNDELRKRVEELAASRTRIMEAQDAERRRLERNLHDGAQQLLISASMSLTVARNRLDTDPAAARELLERASGDLSTALSELRELARGLHPVLLTDRGLGAAVESLTRRVSVPVEIDQMPDERLDESIEVAIYYLIAEALANVAKYSEASTARISVAAASDTVVVEIADDGIGGADAARGSGLSGLADRVASVGGQLVVTSPAGAGTRLRAAIPVRSS
jgi:PAS domain S-box-containing protein